MRHWHSCSRWERRGVECPFRAMEEEEEERDGDDAQPPRGAVPQPKLIFNRKRTPEEADAMEPKVNRKKVRVPDAEKLVKEAEEVIRNVPKPIPEVVRPVGRITPMLAELDPGSTGKVRAPAVLDPGPGRPPAGQPPRGLGDAGRLVRSGSTVGVASAVTMRQLSRTLPDNPRALGLAEEAIVQEFTKAPRPAKAPKGEGFRLTRKQIGAGIAATAGAGAAALAASSGKGGGGGSKMMFNAQARLDDLLGLELR